MKKYAKAKDIVGFGLDRIPDDQTITMNLRDYMYVRGVLEEFVRFFHQPEHYKTIQDVEEFLGSARSSDGFRILCDALYQKMYKVELPSRITEMIDDDVFSHPSFPRYYRLKRRKP